MIRNTDAKKFAILLICCLIVFIKLGRCEIQGWDEGVYAMRALSINEFGAFWDQTEYSPGGLYSSSYPPFVIWIMAASITILGKTAFAVRLFSAICFVIIIFTTYEISKRILSGKNLIYPSVLIAGTMLWNTYSRLGQLDIPVITLTMLCFYIAIKSFEAGTKPQILFYSLILFFILSACLMSKVITTFLPLLLLVPIFILNKNKSAKLSSAVVVILSVITASVWFISMWLEYNGDFIKYISAPQLYSSWNNAIRDTGILFYINQLFVSNPFTILSFFVLILAVFKFKILNELTNLQSGKEILIAFLLWFILALAAFSIARTKYIHYTVYMIPPAIILAVWLIDNIDILIKNSKVKLILAFFLIITFIWGLSQELRSGIKAILSGGDANVPALIFLISSVVLIVIPMIVPAKFSLRMYIAVFSKIIVSLSVLLIFKIAFFNYTNHQCYQCGALLPIEILKQFGSPSYIYLYHEVNPTDSINAQLSWYTDGWNLGWQPGKYHIPIPIKKNKLPFEALNRLDKYADILIIYYFTEYTDEVKFISEAIQKSRRLLCQTKCYIVFGVVREGKLEKMLANFGIKPQNENTSRTISCHLARDINL